MLPYHPRTHIQLRTPLPLPIATAALQNFLLDDIHFLHFHQDLQGHDDVSGFAGITIAQEGVVDAEFPFDGRVDFLEEGAAGAG